MEAHVIVITALSVGGLIAALVVILWQSLRMKWPEGKRSEHGYRGYKVHLIVSEKANIKRIGLGDAVARMAWATGSAWREAMTLGRVKGSTEPAKEVIVRFASGEEMDSRAAKSGYKSIAGSVSILKLREWFPVRMANAVISERNVDEAREKGEPVIHEILHTLEGIDGINEKDHTDPAIWRGARVRSGSDKSSVQERAQEIFVNSY